MRGHWRSLKRLHPRTNTNQIARSSTLAHRIVLVQVMPIHSTVDHRRTSFVSNIFAYPCWLAHLSCGGTTRPKEPAFSYRLAYVERGFTTWYKKFILGIKLCIIKDRKNESSGRRWYIRKNFTVVLCYSGVLDRFNCKLIWSKRSNSDPLPFVCT